MGKGIFCVLKEFTIYLFDIVVTSYSPNFFQYENPHLALSMASWQSPKWLEGDYLRKNGPPSAPPTPDQPGDDPTSLVEYLFTSLLKKISTSDVTSSPGLVKQETGNAKLNNTGGTFLLARPRTKIKLRADYFVKINGRRHCYKLVRQ